MVYSVQGKLNADGPHPRDNPHTPTDYRHTDKHLGLVMTLIALSSDKRTDGRTDGHYLPASRSITKCKSRSMT